MSKKASNFGRDEMNLLLGVAGDDSKAGIGTAGTAILQGAAKRKGKSKGDDVDIASLTTAQTAAMLQQQQQSKGVQVATSRHRTQKKKRMQHHELLEEELRAQQQQYQIEGEKKKAAQKEEEFPKSDSEEDEGDFAAANSKQKRKGTTKRLQMEAQIVQKSDEVAHRRRRRRQRSSSSSSSDSERERETRRRPVRRKDASSSSDESSKKPRRRRRRSPSSSSSSSSEDERRQRRQKKRQQLAEESKKKEPEAVTKALPKAEPATLPQKKEKAPQPKQRNRRKESSSSSSSSSGSGSSSDSDSSDSSSSDDEHAPAMAKPLFVPKRQRLQLAQEKAQEERAQKEQEENAQKQKQKRKDESRRRVVESVMVGATGATEDVVSEDEEALASRMLDDQDDREEETERDLWEVRELERLLAEIDILKQKEKERAEYERRKQLTDEQAREEDIASGRYQQPGSNRMGRDKDGPKYQQKFFHRGAYYLDEEEFEEGDVRFRAKEYEQGVTESARSRGDTRNLPQVMQVKQFGRANQSKYQGLAKEDTSNRESSTLLPLVHQKKQKGTQIPTKKRS